MASLECLTCGEFFRGDVERHGARCPVCRMPLYEPPETHRSRAKHRSDGKCALHTDSPSVGACQQCGARLCTICKTRWNDLNLCMACLQRAMEAEQTPTENVSVHRRQARWSLVFAIIGWVVVIGASVPLLLTRTSGSRGVLYGCGLALLLSFIPALIAIGQAVSAIKVRGDSMRRATWGLALAGSQLGLMLGLLVINVWHS